jgi:hypothetical protein
MGSDSANRASLVGSASLGGLEGVHQTLRGRRLLNCIQSFDVHAGLHLAAAVRKLAEHHFAVKNRHISEDEYQLLIRAAEVLDAG